MARLVSKVGLSILVIAWLAAHGNSLGLAQENATESIRNTGVVPSLSLAQQPSRLFRFSRTEGSVGETCVAKGILYAVQSRGEIQAIEIKSAETQWVRKLDLDSITGIAIAKDKETELVVATGYGGLSALDPANGETVWHTTIEHGLAAPVVVGDRIYAAGYDGQAYCFNVQDGKTIWKHGYLSDAPDDPPGFNGENARFGDKPARPRAASSDGDIVVFAVFDQCRIVAVDCKTGERRWDFKTDGWVYGRPAISSEYVFIGSQDKKLYCVSKSDGGLVWSFATGSRIEASPAVKDDRVLVGSCDANLYCLDQHTGELLWNFETQKRKKYGGPIYEQPMIAGQTVYLPTMEGTVYAFDLETGLKNWSLRPSRKSEIDGSFTDGERLFVTTRANFDGAGEDAIYSIGN